MENLIKFCFLAILVYIVINYLKKCESFKNKENFNIFKDTDLNTSIEENKATKNELIKLMNKEVKLKNNVPELIQDIENKICNQNAEKTNTKIKQYENKEDMIQKIKTNLNKLENIVRDKNIDISQRKILQSNIILKSLENGLKLTLKKDKNNNKFRVYANDKCLSVDDKGTYDLEKCNSANQNQLFNLINVFNPESYVKNELEPGMTTESDMQEAHNLKYPFTIIKSNINNNCLQNNSDRISVRPCQLKTSQIWNMTNNIHNCVDNDEHKC